MRRIGIIFVVCTGLFSLTACEKDEDNTMAKAQECLDKANTTTALSCLAIVDAAGLTSEDSYAVRCSARFIASGFTASRIAEAASQLSQNTGSKDPALTMMGMLAFGTVAAAEAAYVDCNLSGSDGFKLFARAARMGTLIGSAAGSTVLTTIQNGGTPTPAEIETALNSLRGAGANPATETALGETALAMSADTCSTPGENAEMCDDINAAIAAGGGNAQAIGAALLNQLNVD